jgi:hypothetical protein
MDQQRGIRVGKNVALALRLLVIGVTGVTVVREPVSDPLTALGVVEPVTIRRKV